MPIFDRACPSCDWQVIDVFEPVHVGVKPCPACGDPTARVWLSQKSSNVIGDEFDHVQRNGLKHPRRFRSKSEHRRWLASSGWTVQETHHEAGGKEWLANAEALAARQGGLGTKEPEDEPFHITWSTGELTKDQVQEYRGKNR